MNTYKNQELCHPKYRPDIDGMRAIAVLAVVAFHAFPESIRGGFIGVDIFFVISGYLISTIVFESLEKETFSFSEFYARRIKRIFPALIIVIIASLIFGWFALLADEYKQIGKHVVGGAFFASNFLLWNEAGYFDNSADTKPLLHLWSLAVEEQFYIFWPFLLWVSWRKKFNILFVSIALEIISFFLNVKGVKQDIVATFYSPQTRFWELLSGSLLAWSTLYVKYERVFSYKPNKIAKCSIIVKFAKKIKNRRKELFDAISLFGLILIVYGLLRFNKDLSFPGKWALFPVLGTLILIMAGQEAFVNRKILSSKIAIGVGVISFPLYLWHWPLLSFARIVEGELPSLNIRIAAVLLSFILAWFTYKFVERPIRFGNYSKAKVTALLLIMAFIGCVGLNIYCSDGYVSRSSIKGFVNNKNELTRTPVRDEECLKYVRIANPLFPYCRFTNVNSNETVAVIGDSHAHVSYPGIANLLKEKGVNTLLLANSGCPPFLGVADGINYSEKAACRMRINQLLDTVTKHKDIKKVLIFTRGTTYIKGNEPLTGVRNLNNGNNIPIDDFFNAAQLTIDTLVESGKSVIYVSENPELKYSAQSCIVRPFKTTVKNCSLLKSSVLTRQGDYLKAFSNLQNVTFVDSLAAFCPKNECLVFDNDGALLYADDDHLSVAGSKFQVNNLLKKYLD